MSSIGLSRDCRDWEIYDNGFFDTREIDKSIEMDFLNIFTNEQLFISGCRMALEKYPITCTHFLLNPSINSVAYIGQFCAYALKKIPERVTKKLWKDLPIEIKNQRNINAKIIVYEFKRNHKSIHRSLEGERLFQ